MDKTKKAERDEEGGTAKREGEESGTTAVKRGAKMLTRWVSRRTIRSENEEGTSDKKNESDEVAKKTRRNTLANFLSQPLPSVIDAKELEGATEKEGHLFREGDKWKTWKEKWFILKDAKLYYKKSYKSEFVQGKLALMGAKLTVEERYTNTKFEMRTCIVVTTSGEGGSRKHYFFAEESVITLHWYEAMQRSTRRVQREERRRARAAREAKNVQAEEGRSERSVSLCPLSTSSPTPTVRSSKSAEEIGAVVEKDVEDNEVEGKELTKRDETDATGGTTVEEKKKKTKKKTKQ